MTNWKTTVNWTKKLFLTNWTFVVYLFLQRCCSTNRTTNKSSRSYVVKAPLTDTRSLVRSCANLNFSTHTHTKSQILKTHWEIILLFGCSYQENLKKKLFVEHCEIRVEDSSKEQNKNYSKMSQQQTVRVTTTETTTSTALVINSGYLKTPPGILKVIQFVNIPTQHSIYNSVDWQQFGEFSNRFHSFNFFSFLRMANANFLYGGLGGCSRFWDAYVLESLHIISTITICPHLLSYFSTWWV